MYSFFIYGLYFAPQEDEFRLSDGASHNLTVVPVL